MRNEHLAWLAGGGLLLTLLTLLSLLLALGLTRRVSAPPEQLAAQRAPGRPGQLPHRLAEGLRDDEVGALARAFDALLDRTRAFIDREQAFTRDASHELRTPLAVFGLAIEGLQAQNALPLEARQALASMLAATRLMEQTVQTLLLLAREGEAGAVPATAGMAIKPTPATPVLPLAEQWVLVHADWLDAQGQTLDLAPLSRQSALALPPSVLQPAMANLLGNAVAHGVPGGCIEVRLNDSGLCVRNRSAPLPGGGGDLGGGRGGGSGGSGGGIGSGGSGGSDGGDSVPLPPKGSASSGFGYGLAIVQKLLQAHGSRLDLQHLAGVTQACIAHPQARS